MKRFDFTPKDAAACLPRSPRRVAKRPCFGGISFLRGAGALFLGFLFVLAAGCGDGSKPAHGSTVAAHRPAPLPPATSDPSGAADGLRVTGESPREGEAAGYVGSGSCRECHADQHASWHASYHRSMTQLPGTNTVVADFEGVVLQNGDERFTLSREGNEYWAAIDDLQEWKAAPADRKPSPVRVKVSLVTGSHHMQVFWLPAGFGNAQIGFPFTWLVEDRRWAPRNDVFIRDPHGSPPVETWNMSCIRCHSTGGEPRPRKEQEIFDTRVGELGISCEACHGPGETHLKRMREFQAAKATHPASPKPADLGVVQPATLGKIRGSHVCAQCHSMKWFDAKEDWVEHGFRYRPGDDLEATTPVIRPNRKAEQPWLSGVLQRAPGLMDTFFWGDGMIRVAGREFNGLVETACHQRGEMSCLSCHAMHDYADRADQLKLGMDGNAACTTCHEAARFGASHSHHAPGSTGDLCYNCHMPHTTYALLKGVRQHQIDSPRVEATLRTGRPNACNLCHVDRSLAWTADRLADWYGQVRPEVPADRREVSDVVRGLLAGDAGQRALAAWHLGWAPARKVAGDDWQAPILARLLEDPYSAVRYIAQRSLKSLPGYGDFSFDFARPVEEQKAFVAKAVSRWQGTVRVRNGDVARATLLRTDGTSDESAIREWMQRRDDRPVHLRE